MLPLYRNQSVHCYVNQLTGFYMLGSLVVNGLKNKNRNTWVNFRFQKKPFGLQIYKKINKKTNIYWAYQQSFYIFLQCTRSWKNQEFSSKVQANIFVIEYVSKIKKSMFAENNKYMIKICARVVIYYGKLQVSIFFFSISRVREVSNWAWEWWDSKLVEIT